jgi:hypothetical protein
MIPSILFVLLAAVSSVEAKQQLWTQTTYLSHLSPLLDYSPTSPTDNSAESWNISLARAETSYNNASVNWYGFTRRFELYGNGTNLEVDFEALGDDNPDDTTKTMAPGSEDNVILAGINRNGLAEQPMNVYNLSISTNSSEGSFFDFRRVFIYADVPASTTRPYALNQEATDPDDDFFQDANGAWEIMDPPSNDTTGVQWALAGEPSSTQGARFPFNSSILSTSQVNQPLRFTVPPYISYLQWYGTVGPDQGRYEFRLIPTNGSDPQFKPLPYNQSYTGERPVDAIYETKGVAFLDPRATYVAEIVLLEEGKRTDLHGVSFWRYTEV